MDTEPHIFRLLQLLALLSTAPLPNNDTLARDLSIDLPTLVHDGRVLREAQLPLRFLVCTFITRCHYRVTC